MTVEELIKLSMQEMQVIDARTDPDSVEYALGVKRLNTLIASLQNDMVFLTYQDTQSITTVANTATYSAAANTHHIRYFSDRDVNVLSRKDADQYEDSDYVSGRINVFVEYNTTPPTIEFMIAPTDSGDVYEYRRDVLLTDLTQSDDISLSNEALEMLILGLAYKLCPAFGVEVARRESIKADYLMELNKYRQAQTFRVGTEIVAPNMVV